ncbi:non-ribosomal peptide synthetase [Amycolatopsis alba]|uniref:Non-ribosomal peptide synthetase n=1 Tax=Amycolatopsis alba DSM 44262 TaxID=1125972 RepID=A0A229REK6_AMYAL|nr:non-ribosomal peptide synthetase [Amycolatopsis alba]OXM45015.1 non-ribosomal peptide synthetase [Amycolatopsis alba DSM 44262]
MAGEPYESFSQASSFQRGLWFLAQIDPGGAAYNLAFAWRLSGEVDVSALRAAFGRLSERHPALRTRFADSAGMPTRVVDEPSSPLSVVPDEAGSEAEALRLVETAARVPIDLAAGPVFRATLVRYGPGAYLQGVVVHQIAFDQWSVRLLARDLSEFYAAETAGRAASLPPVGAHPAPRDQAGDSEAALRYWERRLDGFPVGLELPRLPKSGDVTSSATLSFDIAGETVDAVAGRTGCPASTVLLATWALLLHRYSRQSDLMIGTPVLADHGDTRENIDCLQHILALRLDLTGDPAFGELTARVRDTLRDAVVHREIGFDDVVRVASPSRRGRGDSLFEVWFEATEADAADVTLPGVEVTWLDVPAPEARYPLALRARRLGDGWRLSFDYATGEFAADTIAALGRHFSRLLTGIAAGGDPRSSRIPLLDHDERDALLASRSQGAVLATTPGTLVSVFEEQVARTPDRTAVRLDSAELSYEALNGKANLLAVRLRAAGVGPDTRVALYLERGLELVVAVLGVLKAGGAYVAIDQRNPADRIGAVLAEAAAPVLLTTEGLRAKLPETAAEIWPLDGVHREPGVPENPSTGLTPENLAYVTYTSGSTGGPKGIAMPHRAVVNLLGWQAAHYEMSQDDPPRTLQFASLAFDVSVQDMFSTWMVGGELVLITEDERFELAGLHKVLEARQVRRLFIPAPALQQVAAGYRAAGVLPTALRTVISGSEQFMATPDVRRLAGTPGMALHNEYGPSETHVVTCYDLPTATGDWPAPVPVGRPIANASVYLLDERGEVVPDGVIGEIHIGGEGLARGYLGRPAVTAERFLPDPFAAGTGRRMYRTGDLGRWLPGGDLEFLGRADFQVKIRGFRVELAEVEAALESDPRVSEAIVLVREVAGDPRLVGYVCCPGPGAEDLAQQLRAHAASKVPDYMVPSSVVVLDRLPLTANGKIDRRALPDPRRPDEERAGRLAPETPTQRLLAEIWATALGVPEVGCDEDFFDLGGHSLLATKVLARVRASFAVDIPLRALFEFPTVTEFALAVQDAAAVEEPTGTR